MKSSIEMELRIPSHTRYLGMAGHIGEDLVRQLTTYQGDRDELAQQLNIVLTEAMANAITHANREDPDKEVVLRIQVSSSEILIQVFDMGAGFDLGSVSDPCFDSSDMDIRGRGIYMIRSLMDAVEYRKADGGFVLEMKKNLSRAAAERGRPSPEQKIAS